MLLLDEGELPRPDRASRVVLPRCCCSHPPAHRRLCRGSAARSAAPGPHTPGRSGGRGDGRGGGGGGGGGLRLTTRRLSRSPSPLGKHTRPPPGERRNAETQGASASSSSSSSAAASASLFTAESLSLTIHLGNTHTHKKKMYPLRSCDEASACVRACVCVSATGLNTPGSPETLSGSGTPLFRAQQRHPPLCCGTDTTPDQAATRVQQCCLFACLFVCFAVLSACLKH